MFVEQERVIRRMNRRDVSRAALRHLPSDVVRTVGMCVLPTVFLLTVPVLRHRMVVYFFIALGTFVVAGTTSSLPSISIREAPVGEPSVWTPFRAITYTGLHWLIWVFAYGILFQD